MKIILSESMVFLELKITLSSWLLHAIVALLISVKAFTLSSFRTTAKERRLPSLRLVGLAVHAHLGDHVLVLRALHVDHQLLVGIDAHVAHVTLPPDCAVDAARLRRRLNRCDTNGKPRTAFKRVAGKKKRCPR